MFGVFSFYHVSLLLDEVFEDMAKTKTPFLSLGAQGSVGGSITAQKRGSVSLLRQKPLPTDPYTLPQAYQRWIYVDYAYLWRQQSSATQAEYRSAGVRFHLTGFQYFMRYNLVNLPDIAAWWKLDGKSDVTVLDSSRNTNNGTLFGPSYSNLRINGALSFDGINDYVSFPVTSSLTNLSAKTVELFCTPPPFTTARQTIYYGGYWAAPFGDMIRLEKNIQNIVISLRDTTGAIKSGFWPCVAGQTCHIAYTWDGSVIRYYSDGQAVVAPDNFAGPLDGSGEPHSLGGRALQYPFDGIIDNVIIYNRALDPTEILRHSLRRYPA